MRAYQRAAVASTFSPTFAAVLAEAGSFARRCGAELEIIHAAAFDAEKEKLFQERIGPDAPIRWMEQSSRQRAISITSFSLRGPFNTRTLTNHSPAVSPVN